RAMQYSIREATSEDCKDIARMIMELASYEKMSDQVKITQEVLETDGFSNHPFFKCLIAEVPEEHKSKEGHSKVGYALYFYTYSTWKGRAVYMEDLYVMPEYRVAGKGLGCALMRRVAQEGKVAGCSQLNFALLDWNTGSRDFYVSQGCWDITDSLGYHFMRCEGSAFELLAQG
uniref:Spermidine/spermine N1-acetyltransferase family member 2a, tandem duplicate 1 n=1 Tax=Lepisosteus oculatus TaxID=7918 RepID=W5N9F4_LEPOC